MRATSKPKKITFAVEVDDVTTFDADVLALKFAQSLFGADQAVAWALDQDLSALKELLPDIR